MPFSSDLPTRPAPLVPPDTDLSSFGGFVLNVDHLLASELVAIGTPEECWAALMLWCRAWKQIPAGSLPNDERVLASFSGAGRRWPKVREVALRGFVLCTDGRLYHRFLCAEVIRTRAKQTAYRAERERVAEWRAKQRAKGDGTRTDTPTVRVRKPVRNMSTVTGTVTGTEGKKEPNGSCLPLEDLSIDPNGSISLTAGAARQREFEAFWAVYPRKVGKQAALRKYEIARRSVSADDLLDGIRRYATAVAGADKQYVVHAARWLHEGRWQDADVEMQQRRQSPMEALYEGAMRAADEWDERKRQQQGDHGQDRGPAHPLLERG